MPPRVGHRRHLMHHVAERRCLYYQYTGHGQSDVKLEYPRYDLETIKQFPAAKAMK